MHTELEDWKNGWFGVQLGLTSKEIDVVIERLQMLKVEQESIFICRALTKVAAV